MAHVRSQIRNVMQAILEDGLGPKYEIYAHRKRKKNYEPGITLVDIYTSNDQTTQRETMDYPDENYGPRIHNLSLYIRVQRAGVDEELDDLLDEDEARIIDIIERHDWSELLTEYPEVMQANFGDDDSTGETFAVMVLRFDLEYRIDRNNPEEIIP